MATIAPTTDRTVSVDGSVVVVTWTGFTEADTVVPVSLPEYPDRTYQVRGTFNGGTVQIQGSNDGTNYLAINDRASSALAFTVAAIKSSWDRPLWVKPAVSAGTGLTITVVMVAHRALTNRPH